MKIAEVMTRNPHTIRRDKRMQVVNTIMEMGNFRHVPVVDEHGALVGIVSQVNVLAVSASILDPATPLVQRNQLLAGIPVEKVMTADVIAVDPETSVKAAARCMREHRINCLPVVDRGRVVGIVTSSDMLRVLETLAEPAAPCGPR